jgi:hypothetical protein
MAARRIVASDSDSRSFFSQRNSTHRSVARPTCISLPRTTSSFRTYTCVIAYENSFARSPAWKGRGRKTEITLETQQNATTMYAGKYKTATNSIPQAITTEYCYEGSATVLCLVAHITRACHLHLSRPITFCRDVNTPYESTRANRCTTTSVKISYFDALRI